jgi:hypothetical protein
MSIRNVATLCAILALTTFLPSTGANASDRPNNFVDLKVLFPVNGLEYEHVFPNGLGLSVAGSYLSANVDVSADDDDGLPDDDVVDDNSTNAAKLRYHTFGVGIKKYVGDHRMFYVAAYPQFLGIKVTLDQRSDSGVAYQEEGSLSAFMLMGAVGWRGVWSHVTLGGELGGGYLGLKDLKITGTDPDTNQEASEDLDEIDLGQFGPTAQVYLGFAF